jgi:hypothetical protein
MYNLVNVTLQQEPKKALELEVKKLENLLAMVREPDDKNRTTVLGESGDD